MSELNSMDSISCNKFKAVSISSVPVEDEDDSVEASAEAVIARCAPDADAEDDDDDDDDDGVSNEELVTGAIGRIDLSATAPLPKLNKFP